MAELPIYIEDNKSYHSDNCAPVIDAWQKGKIKLEALGRGTYSFRPIEDGELEGISSVGYWDALIEQDWGLDWHRNEGVEFSFIEGGTNPFSVGHGEYLLVSDNLTITRPWQAHKVGNPYVNIGRFYWLIIDVGIRQPHQEWKWPGWILLTKPELQELTKYLRQNEQPVWKVNQEIRECFQNIGSSIKKHYREESQESWLKIHVNKFLMLLLQVFRKGEMELNESLTESIRTTKIFLKSLEQSIGEPWTLESMAMQCGMGITRFVYYCKQITNLTPMQFLNHLRIVAASEMLIQHPEKSIMDIAIECGFATSQYFSTVFKKYHGCSPVAFRKQKLEEVEAVV